MKNIVILALPLLLASCAQSSDLGAGTASGSTHSPLMRIESAAFPNIPASYTCNGKEGSIPIAIHNVPKTARGLAIIMDDPDADGFIHWVLWNIPPDTAELPGGALPSWIQEGKNSGGKIGYYPPCPPSGIHHYRLRLFALDRNPVFSSPASAPDLERAIKGRVIVQAEATGLYGH